MPRAKKPRVCGCEFTGKAFKPAGIPLSELEKVPFYRDELEALKLCDFDGFSQEEAGKKMQVSRGTIQRILSSARKKTAMALSECKALVCEKEKKSREE